MTLKITVFSILIICVCTNSDNVIGFTIPLQVDRLTRISIPNQNAWNRNIHNSLKTVQNWQHTRQHPLTNLEDSHRQLELAKPESTRQNEQLRAQKSILRTHVENAFLAGRRKSGPNFEEERITFNKAGNMPDKNMIVWNHPVFLSTQRPSEQILKRFHSNGAPIIPNEIDRTHIKRKENMLSQMERAPNANKHKNTLQVLGTILTGVGNSVTSTEHVQFRSTESDKQQGSMTHRNVLPSSNLPKINSAKDNTENQFQLVPVTPRKIQMSTSNPEESVLSTTVNTVSDMLVSGGTSEHSTDKMSNRHVHESIPNDRSLHDTLSIFADHFGRQDHTLDLRLDNERNLQSGVKSLDNTEPITRKMGNISSTNGNTNTGLEHFTKEVEVFGINRKSNSVAPEADVPHTTRATTTNDSIERTVSDRLNVRDNAVKSNTKLGTNNHKNNIVATDQTTKLPGTNSSKLTRDTNEGTDENQDPREHDIKGVLPNSTSDIRTTPKVPFVGGISDTLNIHSMAEEINATLESVENHFVVTRPAHLAPEFDNSELTAVSSKVNIDITNDLTQTGVLPNSKSSTNISNNITVTSLKDLLDVLDISVDIDRNLPKRTLLQDKQIRSILTETMRNISQLLSVGDPSVRQRIDVFHHVHLHDHSPTRSSNIPETVSTEPTKSERNTSQEVVNSLDEQGAIDSQRLLTKNSSIVDPNSQIKPENQTTVLQLNASITGISRTTANESASVLIIEPNSSSVSHKGNKDNIKTNLSVSTLDKLAETHGILADNPRQVNIINVLQNEGTGLKTRQSSNNSDMTFSANINSVTATTPSEIAIAGLLPTSTTQLPQSSSTATGKQLSVLSFLGEIRDRLKAEKAKTSNSSISG